MKILGLCKRQYTGKDLLDDRYGRLFELPASLSACGFDVNVVVTSYRPRPAINRIDAGVSWRSVSPLSWYQTTTRLIESGRPDAIWVSSDALHVIAGQHLGRRYGIPVVADIYDDYESFALTGFPGLRGLYRRACSNVDAIVTVSSTLASVMRKRVPVLPDVTVIGNAVPEGFVPSCSTQEARTELGLPNDMILVGTAGALTASRGIIGLFAAWPTVQTQRSDARLVIAGPRDSCVPRNLPPGVIDLGVLPHSKVPLVFRALDIGIVCNINSKFGNSCHPQKLVEMIACGLPVVASDVGEVQVLLRNHPESVYQPGNAQELASKIITQIENPRRLPQNIAKTWYEQAVLLAQVLQETVMRKKRTGSMPDTL